MRAALCILLLGLLATAACDQQAPLPAHADGQSPPPGQRSDYLALGDSYTIGEGVRPDQRMPNQLTRALLDRHIDLGHATIIAQTGWTTQQLDAAIQRSHLTTEHHPFGLVTLLIGVNDQFMGNDSATFAIDLKPVVAKTIQLAGDDPQRVLLISIPDYGQSPMGQQGSPEQIAEAIDRFNEVIQTEAAASGTGFVNITDISRQHPPGSTMFADDGLHPSPEKYTLWVDQLIPDVLDALQRAKRQSP